MEKVYRTKPASMKKFVGEEVQILDHRTLLDQNL